MAKILTLSRKIYYSDETLIQQLLSNFFLSEWFDRIWKVTPQ